jgi:hypothetical protein
MLYVIVAIIRNFCSLQVYQVAYVIVKAANSPRPGQWVLERSVDGSHYAPWLYFAMTDSECWNVFGVMPTIGVPRYKSDDEVICTSAFSHLDPLENGEVIMIVLIDYKYVIRATVMKKGCLKMSGLAETEYVDVSNCKPTRALIRCTASIM